jgi:glucokinase
LPNVLAVDLGGTKCSAAVVDRSGHISFHRTVSVDAASSAGPVLQIVHLANELAGQKEPRDCFVAAAIAVPGLVRRTGTVWAPNLTGWERMPVASRLKRTLRIPITVESDRNAAVVGECWQGAGRGKTDVVVLMIGTGIGAGILSGGRLLRGSHELSGCAGWLTVTRAEVRNGSSLGELEFFAAGPGISRAAQERLRDGEKSSLSRLDISNITAHEVAVAARKGDRLSLDVFTTAGRLLGYGIANIVSLLDPQVVILGGGMASAADLYLDALKDAMMERGQPLATKQVKVVVSKLGDKANLLGCARLAWDYAKRRSGV